MCFVIPFDVVCIICVGNVLLIYSYSDIVLFAFIYLQHNRLIYLTGVGDWQVGASVLH